MIEAELFAKNALLPKWDKFKYNQLDCQGFVEAVLEDIGVRKPDGSLYNWKGSNSMYRNFYTWRGTIEEAVKTFGYVPVGAFVYIWKPTGEKEVGYNDDLGNCSHVGIYCGNNIVRDSTRSTKTKRDGVGDRPLTDFNRLSLFTGLNYGLTLNNDIFSSINRIREELKRIEVYLNGIESNT